MTTDAFADRLVAWAASEGRHELPWQRERTPYRVWVSEIMLQQTQVVAVIPYYRDFLVRFPDVETLATAALDDVLALWSGLGYYARAHNLHQAAQRIVAEHGGELPECIALLTQLPGIGRSTAAAILALAHGQRQTILDGNVRRVLSRYHGVFGWPGRADVSRELWALAERHTPSRQIPEYTQAIMDLGAMVCSRKPVCARCPLRQGCQAHRFGLQDQLPTPKPRATRPERETWFLILRHGDYVLLERRPPVGVWGGLWSFPESPALNNAEQCAMELTGSTAVVFEQLATVVHDFSHFRLHITPLLAESKFSTDRIMDSDRWVWYNLGHDPPGGIPKPVSLLLAQLSDG